LQVNYNNAFGFRGRFECGPKRSETVTLVPVELKLYLLPGFSVNFCDLPSSDIGECFNTKAKSTGECITLEPGQSKMP